MDLLGHAYAFMIILSLFFFFIETEISKLEYSFRTGKPNYIYLYYFIIFGLVSHVWLLFG